MKLQDNQSLRDEFDALCELPMTKEIAYRMLAVIGDLRYDDEVAHAYEDVFREKVLEAIDHPLARIALMTNKITFSRWCA